MSKKKAGAQKKIPKWLIFEKEVAKLFELFGYDDVVHNTKIENGQCDVVAKSRKRSKPNVLAECKYHQNPSYKVNITEVQNFIYKVSNYRSSGKIDKGYLVTNSGFTADARAAISENVGNYVFLLTYYELIQSLLDINHYLQEFISNYDNSKEGNRYVELKLINTTTLRQTILDSLPGDIIFNNDEKKSYLVVPKSCIINEGESFPFLDFENDSFSPLVKPVCFIQKLKEVQEEKKEAFIKFNDFLKDCLSTAVHEIAIEMDDELLDSLFNGLPKNILSMISWSCDAVVTELLNKWKEFGGDFNIKTYNKSNFRKRIHREILNKYKEKAKTISLTQIEVPSLLSSFAGHIMQALNIEPGRMESLLEVSQGHLWSANDEFDNIIKHLESDQEIAPSLRLLAEEKALPALEDHINYGSTSTIILIGDYGAGKTTLLRRLMRSLSEKKLSKKDDPNCRIPLFISLKNYNKVPDVKSLIKLFLQDSVEVDNVSVRTFRKLNEEGRFVLLLDAFDEMLTRVTRADRRRCFKEISELVCRNTKIILTGRPAYFNDYNEFNENLEILNLKENEKDLDHNYEIRCLQLLDEEQVEQLIKKTSPLDFRNVLNILVNRPNLMDLARRPVLAKMIADTGEELINLGSQEVSARNIYEIYTDRWVKREEDKGEFRLLVHPDQKSTFLRYLAMQMYISGSLTIHYNELDKSVEKYFNLDTMSEVDHFSHDIRACSFLSRTDDGYYFFIHKSFMEFFVACEFERMESSPFADTFSNDLTPEIIDLLNFELLPKRMTVLWSNKENLEKCIELIKEEKNKAVKNQTYELAADLRELEGDCISILEKFNSIFTMKRSPKNNIFEKFKNLFREPKFDDEVSRSLVKQIFDTHISDFNLDF